MLTETEFAVLNQLRKSPAESQRELVQTTDLSLGTINSTIKRLIQLGYVDGLTITGQGLETLEPYRVKNAIIMAAGMSTRFAPISYEKPKGLLEVHGELLIERVIRQLQEAGIEDITVVVGYKMEQFLFLEDKMNVKIAINTHYDERNNHSTLKIVEDQLDNTYICCSDNYYVENVFEPYVYRAYYAAVWHEGPTDEWGIYTTSYGRISKTGPGCSDAWIMFGQTYFDRGFSKKFIKILNESMTNQRPKRNSGKRSMPTTSKNSICIFENTRLESSMNSIRWMNSGHLNRISSRTSIPVSWTTSVPRSTSSGKTSAISHPSLKD